MVALGFGRGAFTAVERSASFIDEPTYLGAWMEFFSFVEVASCDIINLAQSCSGAGSHGQELGQSKTLMQEHVCLCLGSGKIACL